MAWVSLLLREKRELDDLWSFSKDFPQLRAEWRVDSEHSAKGHKNIWRGTGFCTDSEVPVQTRIGFVEGQDDVWAVYCVWRKDGEEEAGGIDWAWIKDWVKWLVEDGVNGSSELRYEAVSVRAEVLADDDWQVHNLRKLPFGRATNKIRFP